MRRIRRASTPVPAWARWRTSADHGDWSVGIEEEAMLLDARTGMAVNRIGDALAVLEDEVGGQASAETHACVLELKTSPHATVREAVRELGELRRVAGGALADRLDIGLAAAGTHPLARSRDITVAPGPRSLEIEATMRALAWREPTMALHVHVSVPDAAGAIHALDGMRAELPVLLALGANSPYWRGADSGFAAIRVPMFSMFPRTGIPRPLGTYERYVAVLEPLLRAGAIPDPSFVWWDARLQPRFGTVEVRVLDAQSRLEDVAAVAAVIQCLVRHHADAAPDRHMDADLLAERRFQAARDGLGAALLTDRATWRSATESLTGLLERCRPHAAELGCLDELQSAVRLAGDPGYTRQRRIVASSGIAALPAWLRGEYAAAAVSEVAA